MKRRWRTKADLLVVGVDRRTDKRDVKIAAVRAVTGGWHGWLHLKNLEKA